MESPGCNLALALALVTPLPSATVAASQGGPDSGLVGPGNLVAYSINGDELVFETDEGGRIRLKVCAPEVLRIWYAPTGEFGERRSFAVVNETLADVTPLRVEESRQAYEIYTAALRIRVNRTPYRLQVFDKYQKLIVADHGELGLAAAGPRVASCKLLRASERIYGLGEKAGPLDRRGRSFTMWNSDKPCYDDTDDPLYKSMPFFLSSHGYGIFFDNTHRTRFDFGASAAGHYSFEAPAGEMVYYLIAGADYRDVIKAYTQLTGRPIMPPHWALGFSQSRGMLTNEALTREIAAGFRARGIPCDVIFQDIGWTRHLQDFTWREGAYANPRRMLADLAEQGFKVVVSQNPVVSQQNDAQWSEAAVAGYFVRDERTGEAYDMPWPWGGNCGLVDFTHPDVADWWGEHQQKPIDDGVRGFWTDMGEPAWSNEEDVDRLHMVHCAGRHDEIHNVYGLTWDKVVTEQFEKHNPGRRVFQLTRAGYAGMQRYAFGWSGDAGNGRDVLAGWRSLAAQLPLGLSAGLGLIPFWSSDISGYCGDIGDHRAFAELYVRWLQFGVFNPISRAHHEGNNAVEPWLFGPEAEAIARDIIALKYRLFPYIYTYSREAYDTGLPLMRATFLEYPDDPEAHRAAEGQFMFGRELLVAPVLEDGARSKRIYLPAGEWVDFRDGRTSYRGGQWIDYPAPLSVVPVFMKRGSIVPMMPAMNFLHENPEYPLILKVSPPPAGRTASFAVYEDDGETTAYQAGRFAVTTVTCASTDDGVSFTIGHQAHEGYDHTTRRDVVIEFPCETAPRAVTADGNDLPKMRQDLNAAADASSAPPGWDWDHERRSCVISLPASAADTAIHVRW